jgi:hypothetical protein
VTYVDWMIRGPKLAGCSCNFGCPCEFNAPPTNPELCEGLEAMQIDEGWFGDVRLDGVRFGAIYRWPGPVHEGGGVVQGILDVRTDQTQRDALITILGGGEQEPTTAFAIYGSTIEREIEPAIVEMEFDCDMRTRTGRFTAPGVFECTLEPIRNPVTGETFRAALNLHDGFEFKGAEMASADFRGTADLKMEHRGRYGFLTYVAYGPYGLIAEGSYPRAPDWSI